MVEQKKSQELAKTLTSNNCDSPILRSSSYKEAVHNDETLFFPTVAVQNVRAGIQPNLRLFIAISAQIFFVKPQKDHLPKHVGFRFSHLEIW